MDTKKVGDHECIQCGECISVCPSKAISWKGSKLFVRGNDEDAPAQSELKPITAMLKPAPSQETMADGEQPIVTAQQSEEVHDEQK